MYTAAPKLESLGGSITVTWPAGCTDAEVVDVAEALGKALAVGVDVLLSVGLVVYDTLVAALLCNITTAATSAIGSTLHGGGRLAILLQRRREQCRVRRCGRGLHAPVQAGNPSDLGVSSRRAPLARQPRSQTSAPGGVRTTSAGRQQKRGQWLRTRMLWQAAGAHFLARPLRNLRACVCGLSLLATPAVLGVM
jgi:hypothetical protein